MEVDRKWELQTGLLGKRAHCFGFAFMMVIGVSTSVANGSFHHDLTGVVVRSGLSDGKLAQYAGRFDTSAGEVIITPAEGKLIAVTCGERIELFPHPSIKDRFVARSTSVTVTFTRNASGKVNGVVMIIPGGAEVRGRKMK